MTVVTPSSVKCSLTNSRQECGYPMLTAVGAELGKGATVTLDRTANRTSTLHTRRLPSASRQRAAMLLAAHTATALCRYL